MANNVRLRCDWCKFERLVTLRQWLAFKYHPTHCHGRPMEVIR